MQRRMRLLMAVAVLATALGVGFDGASTPACAQGNACAANCRAAHNQCRIATKGSPSCDAQLRACLQSCTRR